MILTALFTLMFLTALLGLIESGLSPRVMRGILLVQAVMIVVGCVAFIVRLTSPDPYYGNDRMTYWEWGGLDPNHIGTYSLMAVSFFTVIVLVTIARPRGPEPPRGFSRILFGSAVVPFVGVAAMIGAFNGH